jgi:hypothetical protein
LVVLPSDWAERSSSTPRPSRLPTTSAPISSSRVTLPARDGKSTTKCRIAFYNPAEPAATLEENVGTALLERINNANEAQVDALWGILKYKEIGIYRKVASMSEVLGLEFKDVVDNLPQDEEGRVLDYKTRHLIHDALIKVS